MNAAVDAAPSQSAPKPTARRWRWILIIAGPMLIAAVVAYAILTGGRFETTDDAYVQIAKAPVAPAISGRVIEIYVTENQVVRRGQMLFRLDARDNQASAQAATAELTAARLQIGAQRAGYRLQVANVQAARETLTYSRREAERLRRLFGVGVISQQQVDQATHSAALASQQLAAAEQAAAQALAALGGDPNLGADAAPSVMQAKAQLDRARNAVSDATIVAPADGVVARVQQMPIGTYLNATQTAFWLLSGQPWIEANFKEDQLAAMKVGQTVDITIDARPDADLKGRVVSFSPGTGSAFSALPAQNATGNWVKVSQRLPVRIEFDQPPRDLAAGLSVKVKVALHATSAKSAR